MIIDSHLHISITAGEKNFNKVKDRLVAEMKNNGIDKAIIIPDNLHNTSCADLDTVEKLIKDDEKFLMIATLRVEEVNAKNIEKIEQLFLKKKAVGFKIFPGHDPVYPTDKRWLPIINLCTKYNFPLIIHTGINLDNKTVAKYNDPKYIKQIAKKNPELKIIVCHYFWPELQYCFDTLKNFRNIYFDTSALAIQEVIEASNGIDEIKKILIATIRNRKNSLIFGTDWPMGDIKKHKDLLDSLEINEETKQKVFWENAQKIFVKK